MKRWLPFVKSAPLVSVVRLHGAIGMPGRGSLSDRGLADMFEKAFRKGKPAAVAFEINSPGGSPVQSSLIGSRIKRLSAELDIPTFAFVEDVAASGGYWLAASADEIHADPSSVVGSIGVISAGFGAHALLDKHGIERRVYTAGKSKSMLDPFQPEKKADVTRLKALLGDLHTNFITEIKTQRAGKLKEDVDLFTGEIWLAQQALDLGLIDGIGHLVPVMQERFGDKVQFRRYGPRRSLMQRFGANLAHDALAGIEERAEFARFGV